MPIIKPKDMAKDFYKLSIAKKILGIMLFVVSYLWPIFGYVAFAFMKWRKISVALQVMCVVGATLSLMVFVALFVIASL